MNNFKQPPDPMFNEEVAEGVTVDDFVAYMPSHSYIYIPDPRDVAGIERQCTLHVANS